jgi:hypothetical protein
VTVVLGRRDLGNQEEKEYLLNFHQTYNVGDVTARTLKYLKDEYKEAPI